MSENVAIEDLDLTDAELVEVLKNHGIDRRTLLKVAGVGTGVAAFGGTAAADGDDDDDDEDGEDKRIDDIYGAAYAAKVDTVPKGRVDHRIALHTHEGDAAHEGFPAGDDTRDTDPDEEGIQGDEDDEDDQPETFFDPVGLHVKPGEIVEFNVHDVGLHTVTAFDPKYSEPPFFVLQDRVPTKHGFTSPPVAKGDSWLYKFTKKGVYDYLCLPHLPLGMVGRIVVFDPDEDDIDDDRFEEPKPDEDAPLPPNAGMVLDESALNPENIVDEGSVAWSDLTLPD